MENIAPPGSKTPLAFVLEQSWVQCPYKMTPLSMWTMLRFAPRIQRSLLQESFRAAYKGGEPPTPTEEELSKPLLGAGAHTIMGLQPPWIRSWNGVLRVPAVLEMVKRRYSVAAELGANVLWEQMLTRNLHLVKFDLYLVWAGKVKNENINKYNMELRAAMAEYEIKMRLMTEGEDAANDIAEKLSTVIAINFNQYHLES